ncbi:putative porin [Gilvimarinus polysaccharolyticus]|uniref:putative porin n=1 Tax=Gilvimarinus polysaccharolyticus TaxID=863921 RepID=UPI00067387FD|nr:putative porin [Gilvimarinus polysaccharolyticus]
MRFKLGLIASVGFLGSMHALAEPYQWEVEGSYRSGEDTLPSYFGQDRDAYSVSGKYYFSPVSSAGRPLAEAAFLARASSVNILMDHHTDVVDQSYCSSEDDCTTNKSDESESGLGVGLEYYVPNSIFYLAGQVKQSQREVNSYYSGAGSEWYHSEDSSRTSWAATVGVMPIDGWLIAAKIGEQNDFNGSEQSIETKYVLPMGQQALKLTGAYYLDGYDYLQRDWQVGADYFFTPSLSIGGTYADGDSYGVRAEKFFTESFSLSADYQDGDYEESFGVSLKARF